MIRYTHKKLRRILLIVFGVLGIFVVIFITVGIYTATKPHVIVNNALQFQNPLRIPPLLTPKDENGEKVFDITIQTGQTAFINGQKTETFGYNGSILGPTIRARTGDKIRMNIKNTLNEMTTVHWHGLLLPAVMDGGPHQSILSGKTWQPQWTIANQAATYWYHPHPMDQTGRQMYLGLAGLFIVDDATSEKLDIPKTYGKDDIPLIVQDRKFSVDGALVYDHRHFMHEMTAGMLGNEILVNGTYAPYMNVPAKLIRLRIINGSNARRYNFGFSNNRVFYQIATDGGLLPEPVKRNRLGLSPGERAELLVDMSNQKTPLTLMSYAIEGDTNKIRDFVLGVIVGKTDVGEQFKILEIRPQQTSLAQQTVPKQLTVLKPLKPEKAVKTRVIRLDTAAINGKKMKTERIDEIVNAGDTEIWTVRNQSPVNHPFHIHGVQFQVLTRNGQKPFPYEAGWKDTVMLNPEDDVQLIMQFPSYANARVPYMFHCHNLEHEDMGMMAQFVIVDKNTKASDIFVESPLQDQLQNTHMMEQNGHMH